MTKTVRPVKIIGIAGSQRDESYTRLTVALALQGAKEYGAEVELIDLRDFALPFCEGKTSETEEADVLRLRAKVAGAQGVILGTPEYHGSFSGVLKNALDLMGFDEFEGKLVGLVGVSGGGMGAIPAVQGLQVVARALHAWTVPQQATIPQARRQFENGKLKNPDLEARVKEVGKQVARFAALHASDQARAFLREWEQLVANPGGGDHVAA